MQLVSIITSVYNKAPWLPRFFNSVLSQSYFNIELIVVDNASEDNSRQIIQCYANKDERIRIIDIDENIGPSNGYANGLKMVKGSYFTFVDADDYIDCDYIEKLVSSLEETGADVSMCVNDVIYHDGTMWHKNWPTQSKCVVECADVKMLPCQLLDEENNAYFGFYMPEIGAVWSKLYKTAFVKQYGFNYEAQFWSYCDFIFNLQLVKKIKKIVYINTTSYHFTKSDECSVTSLPIYDKINIVRICDSCCRIYDEIQDIMNPMLLKASNVFFYRVWHSLLTSYRNMKHGHNRAMVNAIHHMHKYSFANQLFHTYSIPRCKVRDSVDYWMFKHDYGWGVIMTEILFTCVDRVSDILHKFRQLF